LTKEIFNFGEEIALKKLSIKNCSNLYAEDIIDYLSTPIGRRIRVLDLDLKESFN